LLGSVGSIFLNLTYDSSSRAITTACMTKSKTGGGDVNDFITVISSYFILSRA
jgi:hypothetical protein